MQNFKLETLLYYTKSATISMVAHLCFGKKQNSCLVSHNNKKVSHNYDLASHNNGIEPHFDLLSHDNESPSDNYN